MWTVLMHSVFGPQSMWTDEERAEALRRRMQGQGVMDAAAAAALGGGGLRFVSKGETTSDGEIKENFFKAEEYEGYKEGYVYKMSSKGLGYYKDRGPMGPFDTYDVNTGIVVRDKEYDMDKHFMEKHKGIRAKAEEEEEEEYQPKQPGEGRVGALGDLLAENKAAKQESIDKMIHDNRFCPPKALDEEEFDFLAQKAAEKRAKEAQSKQFDADAAIEFKVAQANQSESDLDRPVDISKLFGVQKKKPLENAQSSLLSRMMKRKDVTQDVPPADTGAKKSKTLGGETEEGDVGAREGGAVSVNAALLGLGDYSDSD